MQLANFPSESGVPGIMNGMVSSSPVIFLSGAGGGAPDLNVFRAGGEDTTRLEVIGILTGGAASQTAFRPNF